MKNLLYVIAGLLTIIWAIVFLSFHSSGFVHVLLIIAAIVVLISVFFGKQVSKK
jgi:tryptophan-rich sensory protein